MNPGRIEGIPQGLASGSEPPFLSFFFCATNEFYLGLPSPHLKPSPLKLKDIKRNLQTKHKQWAKNVPLPGD